MINVINMTCKRNDLFLNVVNKTFTCTCINILIKQAKIVIGKDFVGSL